MLGRAELLLDRVQDPEMVRRLATIRQIALEGAATIRRLQEYARTRPAREVGPVDLDRTIHEAVELTRPHWQTAAQSGIRYEIGIDAELIPPVAGVAEELRDAFTNVLVNAFDAMPDGGQIIVRLGRDGDHAVVIIHDTGQGMSEQTRQQMFDPFFTTKGPQRNGLGLSVVWGIVTRHGGTIGAMSAMGTGTTFTIRLPISGVTC